MPRRLLQQRRQQRLLVLQQRQEQRRTGRLSQEQQAGSSVPSTRTALSAFAAKISRCAFRWMRRGALDVQWV